MIAHLGDNIPRPMTSRKWVKFADMTLILNSRVIYLTYNKHMKFIDMTLILNSNLVYPKIHSWHQFEDPSWNPSLVRAVMSLDELMTYELQK